MEFDKSKVYTALNADESLIGAKGYFADDLADLKEIVENGYKDDISEVLEITECGIDNTNFFYLVEPAPSKPKYRPFKDCDELIEFYAMKKQTNPYVNGTTELSTIWVKDNDTKYQIVSYSRCCSGDYVHIVKGNYVAMISLKELFSNYTFLDGSVCGVEE